MGGTRRWAKSIERIIKSISQLQGIGKTGIIAQQHPRFEVNGISAGSTYPNPKGHRQLIPQVHIHTQRRARYPLHPNRRLDKTIIVKKLIHPQKPVKVLYPLRCLETGDRSSVGSGDLSDNHILEVLWELWALESGFRSLTWKAFSREGDLPANYFRGLFEVPEDSDPDMTPYGEGGACPEGVEEEVEEETIRPVRRSQPAEAVIARPLEPVSVSRIRDYAIPQVSGLVRETNLFSLPDPATVVKTLPAGTRIEVLGYGGRYYRVRVDGDLGYVQESAVWTYRNKQ